MPELPVIVLAFANPREGSVYLRDLPRELRSLQEILGQAERDGLCRVELLPCATLDQILDVFTRNRDRVAILHYGGHSDSGRLLLESPAGGGTVAAYASGMATFLGEREGLQLVFLNGCSNRAQVARLLEAVVSSVMATARAIRDDMAREFAVAFYTELAAGASLWSAFEAARGRLLADHDDKPEAYYGHRDIGPEGGEPGSDPADDLGFPWEYKFRAGAELVERWSLPEAVGNPLFGLPCPLRRDLPEGPFRHLAWFAAEHTEVFFGRGYEVRLLYEQVVDPTGPPILLLYGASGVGKSSLLDAGLVPRLEAGGHAVRYLRRDPARGLTGTLRDALACAGDAALIDAWRAEEARAEGRPLAVILDQVDEAFTRPEAAHPRELDDLIAAMAGALGPRESRPRGKLVLGFRKEWLAEIDRRMAEARLPRAKVFLKPLDRRGIIEAIRGPADAGRLEPQYRLSIEDGLAELIADDLLADAGSALAPTLQVLLANMWDRARQDAPDAPRFSRGLYNTMRRQGYLLNDVLDAGLGAVAARHPAIAESGLPLDLLASHTTDLGTVAERARAELDALYGHRLGALDDLLIMFKDRYLIVEAGTGPDSSGRSTRLAHDLLVPLVQQRFRLSVAPGQRARRLLENRAAEWKDRPSGPVLDLADLETVESGLPGMRAPRVDEICLLAASRDARERHLAEKAEQERRVRESVRREKEANSRLALERGISSCEQGDLGRGAEWFALGMDDAVNAASNDLQRSIRTHQAAWSRYDHTLEIELFHAGPARHVAFGIDPPTLLTWDGEGIVHRRSLPSGEPAGTSSPIPIGLDALRALNADGSTALVAAPDGTACIIDVATGNHRTLASGDADPLCALAFSTDGKTALTAGKRTAQLWDVETGQPRGTPLRIDETDRPGDVQGRRDYAFATPPMQEFEVPLTGAISPDGSRVLIGDPSGLVRLWSSITGREEARLAHGGAVRALAIGPDGRTALTAGGRAAQLWDLDTGRPEGPPLVAGNYISVLAFSADGATLAIGCIDGTIRLWEVESRQPIGRILEHDDVVLDIAFGPGDEAVATASADGRVKLWKQAARRFHRASHRCPDEVWIVAAGRDHDVVLAVGDARSERGGHVHLLDGSTGADLAEPQEHHGPGRSSAMSPDGKAVLLGRIDAAGRTARLLARESGRMRPIGPPLMHESPVNVVAFAADGRLAATGSEGGRVRFWDASTGLAFGYRLDLPCPIIALAFSPDGPFAIAGGKDGRVHIWDYSSGRPVMGPLDHSAQIWTIAVSPEGGTVLTAGRDKAARLWDARTGKRRGQGLLLYAGFGWTSFSRDGRIVLVGSEQGARFWDVASGGPAGLTLPHRSPVWATAIGPDGRIAATGSLDGAIRLWDVTTGLPLGPPLSHESSVWSLAFSRDGRSLISGSNDRTVKFWDVPESPV